MIACIWNYSTFRNEFWKLPDDNKYVHVWRVEDTRWRRFEDYILLYDYHHLKDYREIIYLVDRECSIQKRKVSDTDSVWDTTS